MARVAADSTNLPALTPRVVTEQDVRPLVRDSSKRPLLKATAVAEWLEVSEWRVYDLVRQDLIPHVKMGRNVRFDHDAIEGWIAEGGTALPGGWRREQK